MESEISSSNECKPPLFEFIDYNAQFNPNGDQIKEENVGSELLDELMMDIEKPEVCSSNRPDCSSTSKGTQMFMCANCEFQCKRKEGLVQHMKMHLSVVPYSCDICGKGFRYKQNLLFHKKNHEDPKTVIKKHKCTVCNYQTDITTNLVKHQLCHTTERPYQCDTCQKNFKAEYILKDHKKWHEAVNTGIKNYHCTVCSYRAYTKRLLMSHVRAVHMMQKFVCEICSKAYSNRLLLDRHKSTIKCSLCDYHTCTEEQYKKHTGSHSENRFKCDICEHAFPLLSTLNRHKIKHSAGKNFKCYHCDFMSSFLHSMEQHIAKHMRDLYKCHVCGNQYKMKKTLLRHQSDQRQCRPKTVSGANTLKFINTTEYAKLS